MVETTDGLHGQREPTPRPNPPPPLVGFGLAHVLATLHDVDEAEAVADLRGGSVETGSGDVDWTPRFNRPPVVGLLGVHVAGAVPDVHRGVSAARGDSKNRRSTTPPLKSERCGYRIAAWGTARSYDLVPSV